MKKIFVINGSQKFAHSGGLFNKTIIEWDSSFFASKYGFELKVTDVDKPYEPEDEVEKFLWADIIIYHFPIWWFSMPHKLKEYIDKVLTLGHRKGMYYSDGRKDANPDRNYGTAGQMQGKFYMVTTTWNAPEAAFKLPGEFFNQKNEDEGVLFGFHRMNAFLSLSPLPSFHFHDVEKNMTSDRMEFFRKQYIDHLKQIIK